MQLSTNERKALSKLVRHTKCDTWFVLLSEHENCYYIFDWENDKRLSWRDGLEQLAEAVTLPYERYKLDEWEADAMALLFARFSVHTAFEGFRRHAFESLALDIKSELDRLSDGDPNDEDDSFQDIVSRVYEHHTADEITDHDLDVLVETLDEPSLTLRQSYFLALDYLERTAEHLDGVPLILNEYERLFDAFLDLTDFTLVQYMDGWGLVDKQGGNLGGIESRRYSFAVSLIDDLDAYINDYLVVPICECCNLHEDYTNWGELATKLLSQGGDSSDDIRMLDALCNHADSIRLSHCQHESRMWD